MAEGIFRDAVKDLAGPAGSFSARSAGLAAFGGDTASQNSIKILNDEWGIDISGHRAKKLDGSLVSESDLILTMTREQKRIILSLFPETKNKVFTLKEFIMDVQPDSSIDNYNFSLDIMDPYGMDIRIYKKCAYEIRNAIIRLVEKLT